MFYETEKECPCCLYKFKTHKVAKKYCSPECQKKHTNGNSKYNAERYRERKKNPEYLQKRYANEKKRHREIILFLRKYKLEHGCKDCGYKNHHAALSFDHIKDEKHIDVCHAKSISQAKNEIKKCEVVCVNCHAVRTFSRLKNKYED